VAAASAEGGETVTDSAIERETIRRISLRLLPMLFLLYLFAYMDRTNVGIAALQMNGELKFSSATFGFGAGIFFIGYALFEVPSNLILVRVGARRWLARIAITWGLLACAMMLVHNATQFYASRFLLGVAEAGLFPGVVYYLSGWFPETYRARSISCFFLAIPLAQAASGPLGGALLGLAGVWHLSGWQWLFLIEGIPSVLLGAAVLRYLTERPEDARWLSAAQRNWLTQRIQQERQQRVVLEVSPLRALGQPLVWVLAVPYFAYYTVGLAIVFWTPILVRDALHTSDSATANISGGIALLSALGYPLAGMLSDRWGERWGVAALGLALGGAGCVGLAFLPNSMLCVLFLIVVGLCSALFMPAFWCLPTKVLKGPSAAAGIALVNAIGSSGGFFGPSIIGFLRNTTGSNSGGLFALAGLALVGGIVCLALRGVAVFRPVAADPVAT
jgi:ACS family tartrate transporter-like MFS transporter